MLRDVNLIYINDARFWYNLNKAKYIRCYYGEPDGIRAECITIVQLSKRYNPHNR